MCKTGGALQESGGGAVDYFIVILSGKFAAAHASYIAAARRGCRMAAL